MKQILAILLLISLRAVPAFAQADSLVLDENNKLIYYQVVNQASSPADTLYKRALSFFKKASPANRLKLTKEDRSNTSLQAKGGVLVSKKSLVAAHEDGNISFNMVVETKADKYRFWLTDFVIIPYERDRYANYVPSQGKSIPLEKGLTKLSNRDYEGYLQKVLQNSRELRAILQSYMKNEPVPVKEIRKRSVTTKDW